jgi:hypothetical protein
VDDFVKVMGRYQIEEISRTGSTTISKSRSESSGTRCEICLASHSAETEHGVSEGSGT